MYLAMNFYIAIVIAIIVFIYLHVTRNFNYWKNKKIDYLKPTPLFGNIYKLVTLQRSIGEFLGELYTKTSQPYLGFFAFDQPFLLIRDPDLIRQCLIKDFDYFNDRSVIENLRDDEMGSSILFILKNPLWKSVRVKVAAIFATGKMKSLLPLMVKVGKELAEHVETKCINKPYVDAREVCMKFTTDIISSCAFGINAYSFHDEKAQFREVSRRIFDWNISRKVQMAAYFIAPMLVKICKMKFLDSYSAGFLEKIFNETTTNRINSKTYRGDMIDHLTHIKKQTCNSDQKIDGKMLVAQAIQFFIAGFETTGSTIAFALHCLSLFPEVQVRLRDEIRCVIKKYGSVTYEAIQEMEYLDMTVKETLRLYPILPFLDRRCTKPYRLPGTDVVIDKGVPIYISLLGLHFDPKYFPNPTLFEPERFTFENKSKRPTYVYMPFGEGPHNCIGARFGVLGAKVGLIHVLKDFEVEPYGNPCLLLRHDPKGFLIAPDGHKVFLHFKRSESKQQIN